MAITIRPRVPEDDARIVELRNLVQHDREPRPVGSFRHELDTASPDEAYWNVVAELDGEVSGTAHSHHEIFRTKRGVFWASLFVDPARIGRGIGTALADDLEEHVRATGGVEILAMVREDDPRSRRFAERRGYRYTGQVDWVSRLDVAEANLDRAKVDAERAAAGGVHITTLAEVGSEEELIRGLWELHNRTVRDVPMSVAPADIPFELWRDYTLGSPEKPLETYWVALDGHRPVALAQLELTGGGTAENSYTAVDPEYRGRGLARALKYHTVLWAREHGIERIFTGNDESNKPMLAVNVELGYHMLPGSLEVMKELG